MINNKATRFRAYQLGSSGSSFSYFADGHFTLIEGRLNEVNCPTIIQEMDACNAQSADVLHITSWDQDHCSATELPDLLTLVRPLKIESPGYEPHSENGIQCQKIIAEYIADRQTDNRQKELQVITPAYIGTLQTATRLAFNSIFYNPLHIDSESSNDNSTVKFFRGGCFNVLSLGDVENSNISARLRRCTMLQRETDIMILAHHGADNGFTTKNFLHHIAPALTICSADYDNQYEHPRQEIRDLLFEHGIKLMTTKTGDIIVSSIDGKPGRYRATNLITDSTTVSSSYEFVAKKTNLLTFNEDTLRQLYAPPPVRRRL